jgi:polyketide biosynthesis acyl carrier protein
MEKTDIFVVIKKHIKTILPNVRDEDIKIEGKMADLGANSIDRSDIVIQTMEELQLKIPLVTLGQAKNLQDLTDILHQHVNK